jgi:AcrR family transcriptional regulator
MAIVTHPPKQKRTREALERILRSGTQILATSGWDGFTIAAVAERADVGSSAIYRRFKDKDALLLALHRRFEDDFLASWRPAYRALGRADLELEPLVRGFIEEMAAAFQHHQKLLRVFVIRAAVDPRIADAGDRSVAAMALEFEDSLLAHRDQFTCANPELAVAVCFQSALDSFLRLVLFGRQAHPELGWDRLTDELSAMTLAYLLTERPRPSLVRLPPRPR